MERLTIVCDSCEHEWSVDHAYSVYEQQALESQPCPSCGCCTLAMAQAKEAPWRPIRIPSLAYGKAS